MTNQRTQKAQPIPVESAMNDCVQGFGGELVAGLMPKSYKGNQADYLFRKDDVVAELKCLENDLFTPAHIQKLNALTQKWIRQGLIRVFGRTTIDLRLVPEQCRREWVTLLETPIQRVLKKASRQIKETKEFLDLPNAKGVLLLVNEAVSLPPQDLMYLVHEVLKSRKEDKTPVYSSIDWIALFSVNHPMWMESEQRAVNYWVPAYRELSDPKASKFLEDLRDNWIRHFAKLTGTPVETKRLGKAGIDGISLAGVDKKV